ncbi:type 1 glutamine amidotransferase domain-containing protein [Pseudomonas asplenii]|uniref:Protease I n=1 Tax=Pseudomonas asplenii TaxID=53407 RepID=A0A1H6P973_9PSED|nr:MULTISPECIES: type 1 glutamine amidotransferase domain-containing protein [Pseudomonas]UZE27083.1 type 1 glutamine amidotransferase [Pseudomonas asplenii]SEI22051.1 protease I [Pseudomonas fuscovaginae]
MNTNLQSKKVLIITSNTGIERDELLKPLENLRERGATVIHGSCKGGTTQTFLHDTDKDKQVESDARLADLNSDDFDALLIPGGTVNADTLRQDADALRLINDFVKAGKIVASICHGPWTLIDAGVIAGKTLTSYPSVRTDLINAKAQWVDAGVKECPANGWRLITSRNPGDLADFNQAIAQALLAA